MSVSIGQRVQSMIEHMSKGEVELALSDICIAIDMTIPFRCATRRQMKMKRRRL